AGLEAKLLRRGAADQRYDLDVAHGHDDLGHHVAELHGLDRPLELVPGTEHGSLLSLLAAGDWIYGRHSLWSCQPTVIPLPGPQLRPGGTTGRRGPDRLGRPRPVPVPPGRSRPTAAPPPAPWPGGRPACPTRCPPPLPSR